MPLFDFECGRCSHVFEEIVDSKAAPDCPKCGGATSRLPAATSSLAGKGRASMPGPRDHGCCGSKSGEKGCVPGSCCGKA